MEYRPLNEFHDLTLQRVNATIPDAVNGWPPTIYIDTPETLHVVILRSDESSVGDEVGDDLLEQELPSILSEHSDASSFSVVLSAFAPRSLVEPGVAENKSVEIILVQSANRDAQCASAAVLLSQPKGTVRLGPWRDVPVDARFANVWDALH